MDSFLVESFEVHPRLHRIVGEGRETRIEPKSMAVLLVLAERPGEVVSKRDLLDQVWEKSFVSEEVLTTAIWELRKAFGDSSKRSRVIETIPKQGYRLVGRIAREGPPLAKAALLRDEFLYLLVGAALIALATWLAAPSFRGTIPPDAMRLSIVVADRLTLSTGERPMLSPDGSEVAFVARDASGAPQIWLRPLSRRDAYVLPQTENAREPFWSPDGRSLAFFARGTLRKIELDSGLPEDIAVASEGREGAWGSKGVILFAAPRYGALYQVPVAGGSVTQVTYPSPGDVHRYPQFLPDGRHFLYYCACARAERGVYVASLDPEEPHEKIGTRGPAMYTRRGWLIYVSGGRLLARRFDPGTNRLGGEPVDLSEETIAPNGGRSGFFSVADDGTVVSRVGRGDTLRRLVWYDRDGVEIGSIAPAGGYGNPVLSPDGGRVAFHGWDPAGKDGNVNIWLSSTDLKNPHPLSDKTRKERFPVWSADGKRIAFAARGAGASGATTDALSLMNLADGEQTELLSRSTTNGRQDSFLPVGWTRNGSFLLYLQSDEGSDEDYDLWAMSLEGNDDPMPLVRSDGDDLFAEVSPDDRWLAFASTLDGGVPQIFLQRFPRNTGRWQLSETGGRNPHWRGDGKELFFLDPDGELMTVSLDLGPVPRFGTPKRLFRTRVERGDRTDIDGSLYDVTPDGERFLVVEPLANAPARELHLVLDWTPEATE